MLVWTAKTELFENTDVTTGSQYQPLHNIVAIKSWEKDFGRKVYLTRLTAFILFTDLYDG